MKARLVLASVLLLATVCAAQDSPSFGSSRADQSSVPQSEAATQPQATPTSDSKELPDSPGAQQSSANPSAQQPSAPADQPKGSGKKSEEQTSGTSNDRLFWTLPNFLTVKYAGHIPPLTTGQKFKVVARGTFDPIEIVYIGFLSGISQAADSEKGYGQGAAGYGKRFAASFGDNAIENFMTGAILPSLLKQDPRYYQLGEGGFAHRTGYAVSRIFVTRSDSGHTQFNFSEIVGSAMSAAISTYSYHPSEDRNLGNAGSVWGTQVGWDTVTTVVKEFWPDIHRKMSKKKKSPPQTSTPAGDPTKTPDK